MPGQKRFLPRQVEGNKTSMIVVEKSQPLASPLAIDGLMLEIAAGLLRVALARRTVGSRDGVGLEARNQFWVDSRQLGTYPETGFEEMEAIRIQPRALPQSDF